VRGHLETGSCWLTRSHTYKHTYRPQVTKNLVLAGIGLLRLVDSATISDATPRPGNFLVPSSPDIVGTYVSEQCAKGLRDMNPLVDVEFDSADPKAYFTTAKNLQQHDAILAFDMPASTIRVLDELCASLNIPLCVCTSRGVSGWIFQNPQRHEFVVENSTEDEKTGEVTKTVVHKSTTGVGFAKVVEDITAGLGAAGATATAAGGSADRKRKMRRKRRSAVFDVIARCIECEMEEGRLVNVGDREELQERLAGTGNDDDTVALDDYLQAACVPAVNAVLGGIMANDVIKLVSKKGELGIDRMFMYSVLDDAGWIF
jgi:molybdopterin/thiamine biosynthesis adenylyltransferase